MDAFKTLVLTPYNPENPMPPIALQPDWFDMLGEIENQMKNCFIAHRYEYPTKEKEVYIVPIIKYKEAVESGLKFLEFGVLYLTDIVQHIETIQSWNPDSGDPGAIVAYDNKISQFRPGKILGVDVSMGDPIFLWKECHVGPFDFPDNHYILMEKE